MAPAEQTRAPRYRAVAALPNAVTIGRALVALAAVAHRTAAPKRALALVGIAAGGDALDGWLARRLHATSTLGARLDPISDRIVIWSGFIVVWQHSAASRTPMLLLTLREAMLSGGAAVAIARAASETGVNAAGKAATALVLTGMCTSGLGAVLSKPKVERLGTVCLWLAMSPSYFSLTQYLHRIRGVSS